MKSILRRGISVRLHCLCAALLFAALPAAAQQPSEEPVVDAAEEKLPAESWDPQVVLHGYGTWAYGKTDGNHYTVGDEDGDYQDSEVAINVTATPVRNLAIHVQLAVESEDAETEALADYAFGEWRFSDALRLRLGQVQQPFGLYAEIFDVGTLRPFVTLPQSIYGPSGVVSESYKGAGLTGYRQSASGWGLSYDLYAGGLKVFEENPATFLEGEGEDADLVRDVVGGRIVLQVPSTDLSFGFSALAGTNENESESRNSSFGLQVQYLTDVWWIRSEEVLHEDQGEHKLKAGYVEVARFLTPHWQIAGRFDRLSTEREENVEDLPEDLFDHREAALGINYWFNTHLVVKLSVHDVKGNAFALPKDPEELRDALARGDLEKETRLVAFGANFTF